jgi:GDSL-like Lipase/Acylhydrolase family
LNKSKIYKLLLVAFSLALFMGVSEAGMGCTNRVIKIMPIGDSITQGGRKLGEYSYRLPLFKMLKQAGYKVDFIGSQGKLDDENFQWPSDFDNNHEGYYGETTWSVHDTFMANTKALPAPDIALIQLGNNDLSRWNQFSAVLSPLHDIIKRLREKNPKVTILLSELNHNWPRSKYLRIHLKLLAFYENSSKSRIIMVPHYKKWDTKKDTFDGLHPNATGQQKMANTWFKYIKQVCETE